MIKLWNVLREQQEEAFSWGQYLHEAFGDYIRGTDCKRLLNQILTAQEKEHFKTVAILSMYPEEGKTFLSMVVAFSYATMLGKRVLLVDVVNQTHSRTLYLETLLERGSQSDPSEETINGRKPVFDFLTTRSDQTNHIESVDFQIGSYIDKLRPSYDLILLDTCAFQGAGKLNIDPSVVARNVDRAILLMSQQSMNDQSLKDIGNKLKAWKVKLLGVVYNGGLR